MNELHSQWKGSETLRSVFSTSDLLVAEALVRHAHANGASWQPSDVEVTALLLLAKATRLEHVALPLKVDELESQLLRDLWSDDDGLLPNTPEVSEIINVFVRQTGWSDALCETIEDRKLVIPTDNYKPLNLAQLCSPDEETPRGAPLHPGAERFYRERGYLR